MSRVTIGDITEDLLPFTEKGNKVIMVEIVPRKIVEDIIDLCSALFNESCYQGDKEKNVSFRNYLNGQAGAFEYIQAFAEGKLREFEEGGKE